VGPAFRSGSGRTHLGPPRPIDLKLGETKALFEMRFLNAAIAALFAVASACIVLVIPEDVRKHLIVLFWEDRAKIPWSIILLALFGVSYAANYVFYLGRKKAKGIQIRLDAAEHALRLAQRIQQTDLVTGIPNQYKLELDLGRILKKMGPEDKFQLIMIDLDNFGRLNNRYNHQKADEVIACIAQTTYSTMRRNEELYKQPVRDLRPSKYSLRRIYRKYAGGDEFVFLIGGIEADALGFLTRLDVQFERLTPLISQRFSVSDWPLKFHAGVCQLDPEDTVKSALDRVTECLAFARQKGSPSRAFWYSRMTASDFDPDSKEAKIYATAVSQFKVEVRQNPQ